MSERPQWKSRFGFILAAAGSAVGLGNIWKFPYITGENGGGLFVLIYLVCILLVGFPIMVAEIMIGRAAGKQPVGAFEKLQGKKTPWTAVGWMGVAAGFMILSFYIVVAGWSMDYTMKSIVNFTAPIEEQAQSEAEKFIATAEIDDLKTMLIEHRSAPILKQIHDDHRRGIKGIHLKHFDRFQSIAGELKGDVKATAKQRLLLDPAMKEAVEAVDEAQNQIKVDQLKAKVLVKKDVENLSQSEVVTEALTVKRRQEIYDSVSSKFGAVATNGWLSLLWATMFMAITIGVVAGGVSAGIERACQFLMPTLFALICIMVFYGMFQPGFGEALSFVFSPDASKLKASGVLEALGHAFFTLSLGMGAMMTYGSYQGEKKGLFKEALAITFLDTLIAILACLMIFPIIFSYGQEAAGGPGLVFKSMPLAFAEIGTFGMPLSIIFFGLLFFAALTSAISLLEVITSYLIDQKEWPRHKAAIGMGLLSLMLAVPVAFHADSTSLLADWGKSYPMNFFETIDHLASNWMLTLGGLFIAIYAGWVMPRKLQELEVEDSPGWKFQTWLFLVRFVAPALVFLVLLQKSGIIKIDELF